MTLYEVKINTSLIVKEINVQTKEKIRLMELGLIEECNLQVKNKSVLKKNLLVIFNNSCFTIGEYIAKNIVVNYG